MNGKNYDWKDIVVNVGGRAVGKVHKITLPEAQQILFAAGERTTQPGIIISNWPHFKRLARKWRRAELKKRLIKKGERSYVTKVDIT